MTNKSMPQNVFSEATATLEARALFAAPSYRVWNRVGERDGDVYIDLARDDGALVKITPRGHTITYDREIKFRRQSGQQKLPEPKGGGSLLALRELLGLSEQNYLALVAFLVGALRPIGPYFGLFY